MKKILGFLAVIMHLAFYSQDYFPTNSSVKTSNAPFQAIVNATVVLSPGNSIENGTVLFRNGKIIEVGQNVSLPENTVIHDKKGLYVYPSFIDVTTSLESKLHQDYPRREEAHHTRLLDKDITGMTTFSQTLMQHQYLVMIIKQQNT